MQLWVSRIRYPLVLCVTVLSGELDFRDIKLNDLGLFRWTRLNISACAKVISARKVRDHCNTGRCHLQSLPKQAVITEAEFAKVRDNRLPLPSVNDMRNVLLIGVTLAQNTLYVFYVRAWYDNVTYAIYRYVENTSSKDAIRRVDKKNVIKSMGKCEITTLSYI